jgi:hypothetical protein
MEIARSNRLSKTFEALKKTKKPIRRAMIVAGMCE